MLMYNESEGLNGVNRQPSNGRQISQISLRYHQYNPFDHPREVRSSARGFNQNPYKPYIYWKLTE